MALKEPVWLQKAFPHKVVVAGDHHNPPKATSPCNPLNPTGHATRRRAVHERGELLQDQGRPRCHRACTLGTSSHHGPLQASSQVSPGLLAAGERLERPHRHVEVQGRSSAELPCAGQGRKLGQHRRSLHPGHGGARAEKVPGQRTLPRAGGAGDHADGKVTRVRQVRQSVHAEAVERAIQQPRDVLQLCPQAAVRLTNVGCQVALAIIHGLHAAVIAEVRRCQFLRLPRAFEASVAHVPRQLRRQVPAVRAHGFSVAILVVLHDVAANDVLGLSRQHQHLHRLG
mmetsp:Transcript_49953/g.159768  ORF Transcript_49953/g.159768 Transcript_49953/m.159768 type:complete len:285 (-) Transcript_49953:2729-3583(-)